MRRLVGGTAIAGGPRNVRIERGDGADGASVTASHDGYARDFGVIHGRTIRIADDGRTVTGEDSFTAANSLAQREPDEFAVRFHLHPAIKANRLTEGRGVILLLPDREVWTFSSQGEPVHVEESVYLAGPEGPRRAVQIVIYGHARNLSSIRWSFRHTPPATPGAKPDRADEPELPL